MVKKLSWALAGMVLLASMAMAAASPWGGLKKIYFYEANGKWAQTTTLSADIQQRLKEFVTVDMDTQTPYEIHQEIAAVYSASHAVTVSETQKLVEVPRQNPPTQQIEGQLMTYQYRYYPAAAVYFDQTRNLYFYEVSGKWTQTTTLSAEIQRRLKDFVTVLVNIYKFLKMSCM